MPFGHYATRRNLFLGQPCWLLFGWWVVLVAGFFFCQFKLKYMAVVFVGWLVGCLKSQQHAFGTQRRICLDNLTCCHIEIEVADQTFYLTQSQYTDTMPGGPDVSDSATGEGLQGALANNSSAGSNEQLCAALKTNSIVLWGSLEQSHALISQAR